MVVSAAERAYREGRAPLADVEGFIRQILGWREYVRGVYWLHMPGYLERNELGASQPLPGFYWTSDSFEYPNAPLIIILAFLGLGIFLNYLKKTKPNRETIVAFGLIAFGIFIIGVIHFAYYLGDYRFPFIMRYSLVFLGYISLLAAIPLYYLP